MDVPHRESGRIGHGSEAISGGDGTVAAGIPRSGPGGIRADVGADGQNGLVTFTEREDRACEVTDALARWLLEEHLTSDETADPGVQVDCPLCVGPVRAAAAPSLGGGCEGGAGPTASGGGTTGRTAAQRPRQRPSSCAGLDLELGEEQRPPDGLRTVPA